MLLFYFHSVSINNVLLQLTGGESNDFIRTQVVRNYRQIVAQVDPKGGIMDHFIEAGVVNIETKERIVSHVTRQVCISLGLYVCLSICYN